jgi:ankyrin repeat protein
MRAAFAGRVDQVAALLKSGVDVNEKDVLGCTALTFSVVKGNIDVAKLLLQAGADPNAVGGVAHVGFCSVMIMAMTPRPHRLELIDMLIAAGGALNPPHSFPHSPLMSAVQFKDTELINALLERGADVNWANSIGTTALQEAITIGEPRVEVVRLLLKAGADPNKPRLWVGNVCISLLQALDERLTMSNNQTDRDIRDLLRGAGAKKYKRQSRGRPCYE